VSVQDKNLSQTWLVEFSLLNPRNTLKTHGELLHVDQKQGAISLKLELPFLSHRLIEVSDLEATIQTPPGGKMPVFVRIMGGRAKISNVCHLLFEKSETVRIATQVLVQQLTGPNYPLDNMFLDVQQLDVSSIYKINSNGLKFSASTLKAKNDISKNLDNVFLLLLRKFEAIIAKDNPLVLLLSGGYDSRFNLAILDHLLKGDLSRVVAYHEFKDQNELNVAQQIAEYKKIPFSYRLRKEAEKSSLGLMFEREFILQNSGLYRRNIPRWHWQLNLEGMKHPGAVFVGMGAEAHKGRLYDKVLNPRKDLEKELGLDASIVKIIASALGLKSPDLCHQKEYFERLFGVASDIFDNRFSITDFIFYHAYVSNGYGRRTNNFLVNYNISFPFLEDDFLEEVFSLPALLKKDFRIVSEGIERYGRGLMNLPVVTSNAKQIGKKGMLEKFKKNAVKSLRMHVPPSIGGMLIKRSGKGRRALFDAEREFIAQRPAQSKLCRTFKQLILNGFENIPLLQIEAVIAIFLYLTQLESELSVDFECY
jgi:hypothetical protein